MMPRLRSILEADSSFRTSGGAAYPAPVFSPPHARGWVTPAAGRGRGGVSWPSLCLLAALALLPATLWAAGEDKISGAFGGKEQAVSADPIPAEALLPAGGGGCPAQLDFRVEDIRGRQVNLCAFGGKVLLIVNVASR